MGVSTQHSVVLHCGGPSCAHTSVGVSPHVCVYVFGGAETRPVLPRCDARLVRSRVSSSVHPCERAMWCGGAVREFVTCCGAYTPAGISRRTVPWWHPRSTAKYHDKLRLLPLGACFQLRSRRYPHHLTQAACNPLHRAAPTRLVPATHGTSPHTAQREALRTRGCAARDPHPAAVSPVVFCSLLLAVDLCVRCCACVAVVCRTHSRQPHTLLRSHRRKSLRLCTR